MNQQSQVKGIVVLTSLIAPLVMVFCLFAMIYEYGTFSLHEAVQYQSTKGLLGLNRTGLLINPMVALVYFSSLAFWIKKHTSRSLNRSQYFMALQVLFKIKKFIYITVGVFYFLGGYGPIYTLNIISREIAFLNLLIDSASLIFKYILLDLVISLSTSAVAIRNDSFYTKEIKTIILPAALVMMSALIFLKFLRS